MREFLLIIISCAMLSTVSYASNVVENSVLPNGETVLTGHVGANAIRAVITTHTVNIGKPSDAFPKEIDSNCTYSRFPCSLVDKIKIFVNGNRINVPRSVFSDLADLSRGHLGISKRGMTLSLEAGDASEAYDIEIIFDTSKVLRRKVSNSEFPDQAWSVTIYGGAPSDPNL